VKQIQYLAAYRITQQNQDAKMPKDPQSGHNSQAQLKAIIERIERLEEEKKTISDDVRDVYAEAKGNGYDVPALRAIVRIRKEDANKRAERESIVELYMQSLGMLADLPLGRAAIEKAVA
jgi:uncharacterized protein (UPF0335 family)